MSSAPPHILLIDDDPDMHEVVRLILEPAGYRVTCRATSDAGMAVLRTDRPAVLLLDIMLATPTEGLEVAERIRADETLRSTPIVIVSSAPRESGLDVGHRDGGSCMLPDYFLEKPLDARTLRAVVARFAPTEGH